MLMPGKATASSRPDLNVLATSAVFNFAVGSAFILFVLYARGVIFVMQVNLIFEN